jgi:hypothetical protein
MNIEEISKPSEFPIIDPKLNSISTPVEYSIVDPKLTSITEIKIDVPAQNYFSNPKYL